MKKAIITILATITLFMSFGSFNNNIIVNAEQMVWIESHDQGGKGTKYHFSNPHKKFGQGKVDHHWIKVPISKAIKMGYTQSKNG